MPDTYLRDGEGLHTNACQLTISLMPCSWVGRCAAAADRHLQLPSMPSMDWAQGLECPLHMPTWGYVILVITARWYRVSAVTLSARVCLICAGPLHRRADTCIARPQQVPS